MQAVSDLTDLGYKIFLDRYAAKHTDPQNNVKVGDTILVIKITPQNTETREVATVLEVHATSLEVEYTDTNKKETIARDQFDLPIELLPFQMHQRVAAAIASVEPQDKERWTQDFRWLLDDWKFVPAGRILASAGTPHELTSFNCFVLPSPKDSRHGIIETLDQMIEIMSRGGGVGLNLSSLRPRHAFVKKVNGRSSGPVGWANIYSEGTGCVMQAGSRRGALMVMLNDWHPDVQEFIHAKETKGKLTNCNISVAISDAFMDAVRDDADWQFMFPDTTDPDYDDLWTGDLAYWQSIGKPVIVYKIVKARDIWNEIITAAHASAEPGIFFLDRANKMSNSHYFSQLIGTNPCAEQPLPGFGVCNLGAINLAQFATDVHTVHWTQLARCVELAVRFLDNAIDWTPYFFEENRRQQMSERRVGLGTMGLAELMIKCKVRYGSQAGLAFTKRLYEFIAKQAYWASIRLAQEKGAFPCFDAEQFLQSGFMQGMDEAFHNEIRQHGIRNVTLLTSAPTGTTGTMLNTSTGIEPFFALTWWRQSRLGLAEEKLPFLEQFGDDLPDYVVTAMQLSPKEHVLQQAEVQRWVDSAISKTVNVPNEWTVEQVKEVYQLMYDTGCKGGTIYRDGSRYEQVLHLEKPVEKLTCPECGGEVDESTCDVPCTHCQYMGCAVS